MSKYWRMTGSIGLSRSLERAERKSLEKILDDHFHGEVDTKEAIPDSGDYIKFADEDGCSMNINHLPSNIEEHLLPFLDECGILYGGEGTWANEEWDSGFWEIDVDEIAMYDWEELYNDQKEELKELRKKYRELKGRMDGLEK